MYIRRTTILHFLQLLALHAIGQLEPEPELGLGITVKGGKVFYGRNDWYVTDPSSIGLQPMVRYDHPLKIKTRNGELRYIDLAAEAGFLFCKAKVFDTTYLDPGSNRFAREHSNNAVYFPVGLGLNNMSSFSFGAGLFYWKSMSRKTKDIWGAKFLSLGYNGRQIRFSVAGEWYQQFANRRNSDLLLSVEFLYKLIRND